MTDRLLNRRLPYIVGLSLIVITLAVFWQVHRHEFVNYDDNMYITENRHVQAGLTREGLIWAFTTLDVSNWHPLTWLSHMLDAQLYGLNPSGHHLTNLLLHGVNVLLLFWVLRRMTGALWPSAFVAALFAVHPLHVESVAFVEERKDVLSTLFWFLTMWAYVRYTERPELSRYLLTTLFFALGLMAKPMLVTLPFVLLLLDYWPLARLPLGDLRAGWKRVWEKMPLLALAAASSVITYLAQQKGGSILEELPFWMRMENALVSYVSYIGKTIWPSGLAVFYPHPGPTLPLWQVAGAGLLLVCVSVLVMGTVRSRPYLIVGWLWYIGTLVPVIGLIQIGEQAMADRYTYVSLIGLFVMVAWGIPDLMAGWRYRRIVLALSVGIVLSALTVGAWFQVRHWRDSITLFEHALNVTSKNYLAHNNLGVALVEHGKFKEAIRHYTQAIRIYPDYVEAHNNLGVVYRRLGRVDEAIREYQATLTLDPAYAAAHYNLGNTYEDLGRQDEAIQEYQAALRQNPYYAGAHNNLGIVYQGLGRLEDAIREYEAALTLNPDYAEAHYNLGLALAEQGKLKEAMAHYAKALQIRPDYAKAHYNLGIALARQGKLEEAIGHFAEALQITPDNVSVRNSLGIALARQGKLEEAIGHFSEALQINPGYVSAHNNLGITLAVQGKLEEAMAHFNQALRINPDDEAARNNLRKALLQQGK